MKSIKLLVGLILGLSLNACNQPAKKNSQVLSSHLGISTAHSSQVDFSDGQSSRVDISRVDISRVDSSRGHSSVVSPSVAKVYTCSMHNQIIRDKPGNCPICGMALVEKINHSHIISTPDLQTVLKPVNSTVISTIRALVPVLKEVNSTTQADGIMAYDDRAIYSIAARYSGRIEKIYLTYEFQEIKKGQRMLDIYSPELVTAQQDLLFLAMHSSGESLLIQAAREKLLLAGMSSGQINQLLQTRKVFYRLPVYSPYQGHIHATMSGKSVDQVSASSLQADVSSSDLELKEGQYISKGQILFKVIDPGKLWAIFKIDRSSVRKLRLNDPLQISFPDFPGKILSAKVNFIEPEIEPGDRNTSIRVYINNATHNLKVNELVRATIHTGMTKGLFIPRTALYSLGRTSIVWLKKGNTYIVRPVFTGARHAEEIEILQGLSSTDSIARDARYMTDSESFIHTHDAAQ